MGSGFHAVKKVSGVGAGHTGKQTQTDRNLRGKNVKGENSAEKEKGGRGQGWAITGKSGCLFQQTGGQWEIREGWEGESASK